jgi:hypothetical protein
MVFLLSIVRREARRQAQGETMPPPPAAFGSGRREGEVKGGSAGLSS